MDSQINPYKAVNLSDEPSDELLSMVHHYLEEEGLEKVAKFLKSEAGHKIAPQPRNLKECFEACRPNHKSATSSDETAQAPKGQLQLMETFGDTLDPSLLMAPAGASTPGSKLTEAEVEEDTLAPGSNVKCSNSGEDDISSEVEASPFRETPVLIPFLQLEAGDLPLSECDSTYSEELSILASSSESDFPEFDVNEEVELISLRPITDSNNLAPLDWSQTPPPSVNLAEFHSSLLPQEDLGLFGQLSDSMPDSTITSQSSMASSPNNDLVCRMPLNGPPCPNRSLANSQPGFQSGRSLGTNGPFHLDHPRHHSNPQTNFTEADLVSSADTQSSPELKASSHHNPALRLLDIQKPSDQQASGCQIL